MHTFQVFFWLCVSILIGIISVNVGRELTTALTVGIVCSVLFLIAGVVLGVVSVYIKNGVKKKNSCPTSPSPPPLPPPATYEEVSVAGEKSHDIQLTSNESYAHIQSQQRNIPSSQKNIETSLNTAYGVVS